MTVTKQVTPAASAPPAFEDSELLPELLTVRRFVAWSGISRATVYRMLRAGEIASVRLYSKTYIPLSAAQAWLAALTGSNTQLAAHLTLPEAAP